MKKLATFALLLILTGISTHVLSQRMPVNIPDSTLPGTLQYIPTGLATDAADNLWISYSRTGIAKYDGTNFTLFCQDDGLLSNDSVYDIVISGSKAYAATAMGILWADIMEATPIWKTVLGTETYFAFALTVSNGYLYALSGASSEINKILKVNTATLNVENIEITSFNHFPNYLPTIISDSENNIYWAGYYSNGIYKYNGTDTSKIINIATPDRFISMICSEDELWFSTRNNVIQIHNLLTSNTNSIFELYETDDFFNYKNVLLGINNQGKIHVISRVSNYVELTIYDGISASYYKYLGGHITDQNRSFAGTSGNKIYYSSGNEGYIFLVNPDDFVNIMSGYYESNHRYLDRNKVKAGAKSFGSIFWDGSGKPEYSVPAENGTHSLFAFGLWIGGYDESDVLHLSAEKFNQNITSPEIFVMGSFDYLPGPLKNEASDEPGTYDTTVCADFNRVWKIDKADVLSHYNNVHNSTSYYVAPDLYTWPANGPEGYSEILAPFVDTDSDGIYNPQQGDYPEMKGDQMLWWINNDVISPHNETNGLPLGVEIQYTFYSYLNENPANNWDDLINYQTFMNVKIINRSQNNYDSVFTGIWTDADLGLASDDFVGCDVMRSSFYFYNGDSIDESGSGALGYGENPPIQTITFLNSPSHVPNFPNVFMSRFMYFDAFFMGDPSIPENYYNFMNGTDQNGNPFLYQFGGGGDIPAYYMFPGDTDPYYIGTQGQAVPEWSEISSGDVPGDRRGIGSFGPFDLAAGEEIEFDLLFGFIPNHGESETGWFDYGPQLDTIINWWNTNTIPSDYNPVFGNGINNIAIPVKASIFPNPANDFVTISSDRIIKEIIFYDLSGKKVKSVSASSSRLSISSQDLIPGLYIIEIRGNDFNVKKKLMIQ
ncbi:MAG: T9SS type A sorting domain-containing protein [Bacteroidales bacterium]|nr:T9SS type A sorting domain-containing protein [Bacteroidales bacterium]